MKTQYIKNFTWKKSNAKKETYSPISGRLQNKTSHQQQHNFTSQRTNQNKVGIKGQGRNRMGVDT